MLTDSRPPATVLAAAGIALVVAVGDAAATLLAYFSPEGTGAIFGALARDVLLVVGAVMLLRRQRWAIYVLAILFALATLRVLAADEWHHVALALLAVAGLVPLFLPPTRQWAAGENQEGEAAEK